MFKIAEKREQGQDISFAKWKKILPTMSSIKTDTPVSRGINFPTQFIHKLVPEKE